MLIDFRLPHRSRPRDVKYAVHPSLEAHDRNGTHAMAGVNACDVKRQPAAVYEICRSLPPMSGREAPAALATPLRLLSPVDCTRFNSGSSCTPDPQMCVICIAPHLFCDGCDRDIPRFDRKKSSTTADNRSLIAFYSSIVVDSTRPFRIFVVYI